MTDPRIDALLLLHTGHCDGPGVLCSGCILTAEIRRQHTEVIGLRAERDELKVQVTEWELQAVRDGLLCPGDLEGSTR